MDGKCQINSAVHKCIFSVIIIKDLLCKDSSEKKKQFYKHKIISRIYLSAYYNTYTHKNELFNITA